MCIVSMVSDHYHRQYPNWDTPRVFPQKEKEITQEEITKMREFLDLIKKAEEIDQKTNQPDCVDNRKEIFLKKVLEAVKEYERQKQT